MVMKIIRYPLVRLIIGIALIIAAQFAAGQGDAYFKTVFGIETDADLSLSLAIFIILAVFIAYWILVRIIEGRRVTELAVAPAIPELFVGLLIGAGFISAVMAVLYFLGHVEFNGFRGPSVLVFPLIMATVSGFWEEVFFRGVFFRITEEWLGSWIALLISAGIFGALHLGNDNATLLAGAAIAIEAGILLGAIYMVTRRLWVAIGVHAGWNFTLGGIYGGAVSGGASDGVLITEFSGPEMMTGGPFGVEASLVTVVLGVLMALYFLLRAHQKGQFVAPPWARG